MKGLITSFTGSVIKRPTDCTMSTTSRQTNEQMSNTSEQMSTTSQETSITSGQMSTTCRRKVLRVTRQVNRNAQKQPPEVFCEKCCVFL